MRYYENFRAQNDGLDHIRLMSSQVFQLDKADESVDQAVVRCLIPGLREAAPHCPGDPLIFWDDPLMKQPVPRVTQSVDAVIHVAELLDKQSGPKDFKFATYALLTQSADVVSAQGTRGQKLGEVLARAMLVGLLERTLWLGLDKLEERRVREIEKRAVAVSP